MQHSVLRGLTSGGILLFVIAVTVVLGLRPYSVSPLGNPWVDSGAVWRYFLALHAIALSCLVIVASVRETDARKRIVGRPEALWVGVLLLILVVLWAGYVFMLSLFGGDFGLGLVYTGALVSPPLLMAVGMFALGASRSRYWPALIPALCVIAFGAVMTYISLRGY